MSLPLQSKTNFEGILPTDHVIVVHPKVGRATHRKKGQFHRRLESVPYYVFPFLEEFILRYRIMLSLASGIGKQSQKRTNKPYGGEVFLFRAL
jgi:hypothetical protein